MTAQPKDPKGWSSAHDATLPSGPDARALAELAAITKQLVNVETLLPRAFHILRDAQAGAPGAQSYDGIGRSGGKVWCWAHQQEHRACDNLDGCRPETITVNDPAGEAALIPDRAAHQQQEIRRSITRLLAETRKLTDHMADAAPAKRTPTDKDRRETAMDNTPGCEVCATIDGHTRGVPWWQPIYQTNTTVNGNLSKPMDLDRWVYDFVRTNGRLPTKQQLEQHRDGVRVTVKA